MVSSTSAVILRVRTFMSWVVHGDALEDLELGRESVPRYKNYLGPFI